MEALLDLAPEFWQAAGETLYMVALTMVFGGAGGFLLGTGLYATRAGGLLPNAGAYNVLTSSARSRSSSSSRPCSRSRAP